MAHDIEIRPRRKNKEQDDQSPVSKSVHPLETEEATARLHKVQDWRRQAQQAQAQNRFEMARDEDFVDGDQWSAEDKAALEERGQLATVFNLVATTARWVTGTEKRTRVDYRVLPRHKAGLKDAESKTKLLKYIADVNKAGFARSKAFEQTTKAGLGWLEIGIRSDSDDEPLFLRWESWRNMWYDPLSVEADLSDARFVFREKWVDLDVAQAMFSDFADALKNEAYNVTNPAQLQSDNQYNPYLYGDVELQSFTSVGDLWDSGEPGAGEADGMLVPDAAALQGDQGA